LQELVSIHQPALAVCMVHVYVYRGSTSTEIYNQLYS